MLELAILGLLKDQELHGYELKRRLSETLGPFASVSYGSLYPALNRLEKAGAVQAVNPPAPEAAAVPATGSLGAELAAVRARRGAGRSRAAPGGRGRKVYGITERGHELFSHLLTADPSSFDDDREFGLRLAFARFLPPDARVRLLERRRAALVERLARTTGGNRQDTHDSYTAELLQHGAETTERDISWLDNLIARERATSKERTSK